MKNQDVDKNEIADHCWKNDHEMNWEEWKVIDASYNLPEIWIPNLNLN